VSIPRYNHPSVYRSDDGGDSWIDIANGLPSVFGFPLVANPSRGDTAYLIPLESDQFRVPIDGAVKVWVAGRSTRQPSAV
jgi:hypothetical protein